MVYSGSTQGGARDGRKGWAGYLLPALWLVLGSWTTGCLGGVAAPADSGTSAAEGEGEGEGGWEGEGEGLGEGEGEGEGGSEGEGEGTGEGEGEGEGECSPLQVQEHPGAATFGSPCSAQSDCASGVCARMGSRNLCSKFCIDDLECPTAQSWFCVPGSELVDGRRACLCIFQPS